MSKLSRRGSIPIEPLIFVAWLAIAAALIVPLIPWARELVAIEGMGFGAAFWVEVKRHWVRSALGGVFLLLAVWSVVSGRAFNFGKSDLASDEGA